MKINKAYRKRFQKKLNINLIFVLINVICFVLFTILIYSNSKFLDYIALKPSNILQGKYLWTFITSMFMHGGFFHLFVNMFSLLFVGNLVQKILGAKRFTYFYLISGLIAGALFVLSGLIFPADMVTYAVGASGALFGLIGLLMLITPNLPVYIMFIPIPIKLKFAAPIMLIALWLISILGNVPIGNIAHLGGLLVGLSYGLFLRRKYKNKTRLISKHFS